MSARSVQPLERVTMLHRRGVEREVQSFLNSLAISNATANDCGFCSTSDLEVLDGLNVVVSANGRRVRSRKKLVGSSDACHSLIFREVLASVRAPHKGQGLTPHAHAHAHVHVHAHMHVHAHAHVHVHV